MALLIFQCKDDKKKKWLMKCIQKHMKTQHTHTRKEKERQTSAVVYLSWEFFGCQDDNIVNNLLPSQVDRPIYSKLRNLVSCKNQDIQSEDQKKKNMNSEQKKWKGFNFKCLLCRLIDVIKEPQWEYVLTETESKY